MREEIFDTWKVSTETTTPSSSRNPATTRGTPGRKLCAHHFSSLNLKIRQIPNINIQNSLYMTSNGMMGYVTVPSVTCGSCCAVWACRSQQRSSAPHSSWVEVERQDLYLDSPPHQKTAVCGLPIESAPLCRRPRWCWPLHWGQVDCGCHLQGAIKVRIQLISLFLFLVSKTFYSTCQIINQNIWSLLQ